MRLNVSHVTRYHYDTQVPYALQQLRMTPKSRAGQTVLSWNISVDETDMRDRVDMAGGGGNFGHNHVYPDVYLLADQ